MDHLLRNTTEGHYPSYQTWWGSKHLRLEICHRTSSSIFFKTIRNSASAEPLIDSKKGKVFERGLICWILPLGPALTRHHDDQGDQDDHDDCEYDRDDAVCLCIVGLALNAIYLLLHGVELRLEVSK